MWGERENEIVDIELYTRVCRKGKVWANITEKERKKSFKKYWRKKDTCENTEEQRKDLLEKDKEEFEEKENIDTHIIINNKHKMHWK